jgi:small subunit ribosomal protein S18
MKGNRATRRPIADIVFARLQNFSVMSEYVSALGRIKHRDQTGLRPVNQRKISKAIRRAMGLGLMPSVHRHPEILATELRAKLEGGNF